MSKTFVFYESWWDNIEETYTDPEVKKSLYLAIIQYGVTGEKTFPTEILFLKQVYAQIDAAEEKRDRITEARSKAGSAGTGEAKARYGNKNATKRNKTQDNINMNTNLNSNNNTNINENSNMSMNINNLVSADYSSLAAEPECAAAQTAEEDEESKEGEIKERDYSLYCSDGISPSEKLRKRLNEKTSETESQEEAQCG